MDSTDIKLYQVFFGLVLFIAGHHQVHSFSLPSLIHKMQISNFKQTGQDLNLWLSHPAMLDYLRKIDGTSQYSSTPSILQSFNWKKCSSSPSLLNLTSLDISPDPLHFPGTVSLQFAGTLKETVDAPLKLKVLLKKEITETFWIDVPCFEGVGSCTYSDLCETLQGATCPQPFVKYGVPCKCPFSKGSYKMQQAQFKVDVKDIPIGNYYVRAATYFGHKPVACIEIDFSIRK